MVLKCRVKKVSLKVSVNCFHKAWRLLDVYRHDKVIALPYYMILTSIVRVIIVAPFLIMLTVIL
jgi:hypothetical protein